MPNRLLVTADGRPSKIEAAFNTRLRQFNLGGRSVFANTVDALIPDALNGIVHSVLGLQNADQAQPLFVRANAVTNASSGTTVGHSPAEFPAIYDALSIPTGGGVNVGIVTTGDLTAPVADLQAFESQNGIAPVPLQFVPSEVNGSDPSAAVEWILDSQSIVGISGGVRTLYFYNAPSRSDADLTADYNRAVSDDLVKAVNVSLGICEQSPHSSGTMATDDGIFKMAMAEGMTFFVSTGDGGANTGCSSQKGLTKAVGYPASSPYVVAVGGTTLSTTNGTTYAGETAWSGSGGGTSKFETAQSWQQAVTGSTAREVPDVAMDADPNSGAILIVGSSTEQVGGTSLAAPLSVGTWARVQTAHGGSLGFAAPVIYAAAAKSPSPFHDVTSGGNGASLLGIQLGGYKAGVGYDEVTGFGSFDIARFSAVAQ